MVPMKMRNENVGVDRLTFGLTLELLAQCAESRATIEDVEIVAQTSFHTGGVSSIAHIVGLGGRRRSAHAPELDTHTPPLNRFCLNRHLPTAEVIRQFIRWLLSTQLSVIFIRMPWRGRRVIPGWGTTGWPGT